MNTSLANSALARRAGRIAFGAVLALGMLVLAVFAIRYGFRAMPIHAWQILVGTWVAAFMIAGLMRTLCDVVTPVTDDDRLRVAAFVLPAIGLALIAPLTIHALVLVLANLGRVGMVGEFRHSLDQFDDWAVLSLAMTGPAHVIFAVLVGWRAKQLACDQIPTSVGRIYLATTIAACVPGIVLVLPPMVVALTGLPLLPLLHGMPNLAARDRIPRVVLPTAIAKVV